MSRFDMHPRALRLLVAAVLVAGCGTSSPGASNPAASSPNATTRFADWNDFPVRAVPRPVVLTSSLVMDPATGFRTAEDKRAYQDGQFQLASTLPADAAAASGYPLISAGAALDILKTKRSNQPAPHPLIINAVSLTRATFGTDRGPAQLPAWSFTLSTVAYPAIVLAVSRTTLWPRPLDLEAYPEFAATVSQDGRILTYRFGGSPSGPSPCGASYRADVSETTTTVFVIPQEIKPNPLGTDSRAQACPAIAMERTVAVHLKSSLGNRVLVTQEGKPVPVTS